MAFSCGFFDANNKDRIYTAEDFTSYLSSLICNGILDTYGGCFQITAHSNLTVTIGTGKAWINGHYFENDSDYDLDLSPYVSQSDNRHVLVGICCDTNTSVRQCSLVVSADTVRSEFSGSDSQSYLTLASIYLPAGATQVTAGSITDYRENEQKCGYVKCILGKCSLSELIKRLDALESRAAVLEGNLGLAKGIQHAIAYSNAAVGLAAAVDLMGGKMSGPKCIVGAFPKTDTTDMPKS